jgi:hypothetical protein
VHVFISLLLAIIIFLYQTINNESVINAIFTVAGYTYGPLLGLYSFGLFTRWKVKDHLVPIVAIAAPLLSLLANHYSEVLLNGYRFGFELLILNGLITFLGLLFIKKPLR